MSSQIRWIRNSTGRLIRESTRSQNRDRSRSRSRERSGANQSREASRARVHRLRRLHSEYQQHFVRDTVTGPFQSERPPCPHDQSNSNGNNGGRRRARVRRQRGQPESGSVALGIRLSARMTANFQSRNRNSAVNNNVAELTAHCPDAHDSNHNGSARRRGRHRTAQNEGNGEDTNSSRPQVTDSRNDVGAQNRNRRRSSHTITRRLGRREGPRESFSISLESQRIFRFGSTDHEESSSFDNLNYAESDEEELIIGAPDGPQGNASRNHGQQNVRDQESDVDAKSDDVIITGDNISERNRVQHDVDAQELSDFLRMFHRRMGSEFVMDIEEGGRASADHERQQHIDMLPTRILTANDLRGKSCRICLQPFKAEDEVKTLLCFHQFHTECADSWFQTKLNCPACRHTIVAESDQT